MTRPLLSVHGLRSGYGSGLVLRDLELRVEHSAALGIVGRNGMGKTTLMHTLMGMIRPAAGRIELSGVELAGRPSHEIWNAGLALVPQGRRVFAGLTVAENFAIISKRPGLWTVDTVYDLFPRLFERRRVAGGQLSGGEQQMLAIGRALLGNPDLLLLDEPCEGLAPAIVHEVGKTLRQLRDNGQSIVLVEQKLELVLGLATSVVVMEKGAIEPWVAGSDPAANEESLRAAIGVG